ncbi:MAG: 30S ribosomal protein S2 [Candidatus Saccharibacteria bacterium]|nr:30S ribosomal protein S2 [Candidatus Saccharibacteria bacterium]
MSDIDIKALFEAGVHFGHKTSRWHPKMAPYIHSKQHGSHIIDLEKTVDNLEKALSEVSKKVAKGGKVLIVGTKKSIKDKVKTVAESIDQPYVCERWIGGMLTNGATISSQIRKLHQYEKSMASGEFEKRYSKLEIQRYQEEIDALNLKYSGIKNLVGTPAIVFVTDAIVDKNAIKEANKMKIPVIALVDTNVNPEGIDYVVPANDDAIKGVELILDYLAETVKTAQKSAK